MGWIVVLFAAAPPADGPLVLVLGTDRWRGTITGPVGFSADGKRLLAVSHGKLLLWDRATGQPLPSPETNGIIGLANTTDDRTHLITLIDHTVHVSELMRDGTVKLTESLRVGGKVVRAQLSPDGRTARCVYRRAGLFPGIEFADTSRNRFVLAVRNADPLVVAFSPDGKQLVAGASKDRLTVFDTATGKRQLALDPDDMAARLYRFPVVSPDGKALIVQFNGAARRYDLTTGRHTAERPLSGPFAFSPDGSVLAAAAADDVHLLDPVTLKTRHVLDTDPVAEPALAFSLDGTALLVGGRYSVAVWDVRTGRRETPQLGHPNVPITLAFSADGKRLASGYASGHVLLWDLTGGRLAAAAGPHERPVAALAFSPAGRTLASGDADGEPPSPREAPIRLLDAATGRPLRTLGGHLGGVGSLAFTADGRRLFSAGKDARVRWWDVNTGERLGERRSLLSPRVLGTLPDGSAVTLESDGTLTRIDPAAAEPPTLKRAEDPWRMANAGALMPGGRHALFVFDGALRRVDVASGKEVRTASTDLRSAPFRLNGPSFALSPRGDLAAFNTNGHNGPPALYDLIAGRPLVTLDGPERYAPVMAFSPDGRWLAWGCEDTTVRVYDARRLRIRALVAELAAGGEDPRQLELRLREVARAEQAGRQLLEQLDDESYARREAATQALIRMGLPVAPLLGLARRDESLEIRMRVGRVLSRLPPKERAHWTDLGRLRSSLRTLVWLNDEGRAVVRRLAALPPTIVSREAAAALEEER